MCIFWRFSEHISSMWNSEKISPNLSFNEIIGETPEPSTHCEPHTKKVKVNLPSFVITEVWGKKLILKASPTNMLTSYWIIWVYFSSSGINIKGNQNNKNE